MQYLVQIQYLKKNSDLVESSFQTDNGYLVQQAFHEYMEKTLQADQKGYNYFRVS